MTAISILRVMSENRSWAKDTPISIFVFNFQDQIFHFNPDWRMYFFSSCQRKSVSISSWSQVHPELDVNQLSAPEKTYKCHCSIQYICWYCKDQVYASKSIVFVTCTLYNLIIYANNSVITRQLDLFGLPKSYLTYTGALTKLSVNKQQISPVYRI